VGAALEVVASGSSGPRLVLFHGGAPPEATWAAQAPLADRWRVDVPRRRGFGSSPPLVGGRQDWEVDAADLLEVLRAGDGSGAHVVGFSYGGVGAAVAAASDPSVFLSLTIIEAPLFALVPPGDPVVEAMVVISDEFLDRGLDADPERLDAFLRAAGMPRPSQGPLPQEMVDLVAMTVGGRKPGEANPDLARVREAGVRSLVMSGDHLAPLETVCDAVAAELGAERLVLRGRGHGVMHVPGFNDALEAFLAGAPRQSP
jgi:pimeloyl-ACP methyl ester carboxylesterase